MLFLVVIIAAIVYFQFILMLAIALNNKPTYMDRDYNRKEFYPNPLDYWAEGLEDFTEGK
jgi:hypothetical protein